MVDFWSSWCVHCRKSLPYFNKLRAALNTDQFEIYAINLDDEVEKAVAFLAKYPITYPTVWDEEQNSPEDFNVMEMPTSFLVDQNGVVHKIYVGFKEADILTYENDIRRLLGR